MCFIMNGVAIWSVYDVVRYESCILGVWDTPPLDIWYLVSMLYHRTHLKKSQQTSSSESAYIRSPAFQYPQIHLAADAY
jgi:hypothetical protein